MAPTASIQIREDNSDESLGDFYLLDDVFKLRAADETQTPLVAFPKPERAVMEFEYHTGQDLDRFVDLAAKNYTEANIKAVSSRKVLLKLGYMPTTRDRMTGNELHCSDTQT